MLSCIGEQFGEFNESICGCCFNNKWTKSFRVIRIAIWTKDKNDDNANRAIGLKLREILKLNEDEKISFSWHFDSEKTGTGYSSNIHMEL